MDGQAGMNDLRGWTLEHKHRDQRTEGASGNCKSNHWLEKEGIYLEKELVKAGLGLGSILLRTGSYAKVFCAGGRYNQRQAPGKFIWPAHGLDDNENKQEKKK